MLLQQQFVKVPFRLICYIQQYRRIPYHLLFPRTVYIHRAPRHMIARRHSPSQPIHLRRPIPRINHNPLLFPRLSRSPRLCSGSGSRSPRSGAKVESAGLGSGAKVQSPATLLWGLTPATTPASTAHPTLLWGLTPATTLNSSNHPQIRFRFSITTCEGIFPSAVLYFVLHSSPSVKCSDSLILLFISTLFISRYF